MSSFELDIKAILDTKNFPNFRLIINIPQNFVENYRGIKERITSLHQTCFLSGIDFVCTNDKPCSRLIFITNFKLDIEYKDENDLNTLIQKLNPQDILNFLDNNSGFIQAYLRLTESNLNEIYDVCTAFESRKQGYSSNLLSYVRKVYGTKACWIGVKLMNEFVNKEEEKIAFNEWLKKSNYKQRSEEIIKLHESMVTEEKAELIEQEEVKTQYNLKRLFKLQNKYWKYLAELYINNGFTVSLITDKTPSGMRYPDMPWFLSLFLIPGYNIDNQGNVYLERRNQGFWALKTLNNYNLMFKGNVQDYLNQKYKEFKYEEISGSFFVDDVEFDGDYNAIFSLKPQTEVFLGFETQQHYETLADATRFHWHLHPEGAYQFYKTTIGFPSLGDYINQISNIKKLNFFNIVYSKEGMYLHKMSPPIQYLLLILDNEDKYNRFSKYFYDIIGIIYNQFYYPNEMNYQTLPEKINFYLSLLNSASIKSFIDETNYQYILSILNENEKRIFELIYQMNCQMFEVLFKPEFENLNKEIKETYDDSNNLKEFLDGVENILQQYHYEDWEVSEIISSIEDAGSAYYSDKYEDKDNYLSRILTNKTKIYQPFLINNFINYSPMNTIASNFL